MSLHNFTACSLLSTAGYSVEESWVDSKCDLWDSPYGWERDPCSACTLPNTPSKSIQFELRGLCDRTGFDTDYMVTNEETTGLITYIGKAVLSNLAFLSNLATSSNLAT